MLPNVNQIQPVHEMLRNVSQTPQYHPSTRMVRPQTSVSNTIVVNFMVQFRNEPAAESYTRLVKPLPSVSDTIVVDLMVKFRNAPSRKVVYAYGHALTSILQENRGRSHGQISK
ncbi:hypothetical protein DPMN_080174 [Dreissena polymorpha]|uniref:Uncharacterized protein n=1 Tax=Dreissena polymorpha TaxID=45954 RepID=A0A9D4BQR1_DREPO|nr:hypothetical protein DPMN_080174 [Dreissena polymorpha]